MEHDREALAASSDPVQPRKPGIAAALSAVARIFVAPRSVYEQIRTGLPWWPALLLFALALVLIVSLFLPLISEALLAMVPPVGASAADDAAGDATPGAFIAKWRWIIPALGLLDQLITLVVSALFYWLAIVAVFGALGFGRLFTLRVYVSFVDLLFLIITFLFIAITEPDFSSLQELRDAGPDLSLALLFPADAEGVLIDVLRSLNVFALWRFVLLNAGIAHLIDRRWTRTFWPVAIIFGLGLLAQILQAQFQGLGG